MWHNRFEQFLQHRHSLLIQYRMGDLSKHEFVMENYQHLEYLNIEPFERIDNIKKAIYNYHYYNVRAKYWQRLSTLPSIHEADKQEYRYLSNEEYRLKDSATVHLLRIIQYKSVEAYPVVVHSRKLKGILVEIVLTDPDVLMELRSVQPMDSAVDGDDLILHTRSSWIADLLRENGVFSEKKRHSLAGVYINDSSY